MPRLNSLQRIGVRSFGTCLNFSGSSQYITISDASSLDSSVFSVSFWVYKNAENNNFSRIMQKSNGTTQGFIFLFDNSTTKRPYFEVRNSAGSFTDSFGTPLVAGNWRHIVGTFDGNTVCIYENGVLQSAIPFIGTFTPSTNSLFFATKDGIANFGNILLDDVSYYNIALNADQVKQLYNVGADSLIANLNGYWKFDEGSGTTANDSSGNGNTGTITGATYSSNVATTTRTSIPVSSRTTTSSRTKVLTGSENYLIDTFQGTNGTFINTHTPDTIIGSGTWSQTAGTSFWIQSNQLQADRMTDGDLATIDVGLSDITLTGIVIPFGDGTNRSYPGLVFRYVNANNFWYVYPDTDNGYIRMYKVVAGVSTKMIDYTVSLVSGTSYTIGVKCKDRNITFYFQGNEIVTVVDTFNQTATQVGVRYGKSNTPATSAIWKSLTVTPFSGLFLDWPLFTEYSGNPVVPHGTTGQWDFKDVNNPNVIWDPVNSDWLLYYSGYDGDGDRIQDFGLASATRFNLLSTWTKNAGNPVVTSNAEDGIYAWNGGIIYYNGQFYNYYVSNNGQKIRLITSPDLSTWTRQGLVIDAGPSGSWDDGYVFDPFARIMADGKTIEVWYAGQNAAQTSRGLGRATSTDGITFFKDPNNPIITTPLWANVFSNLGEPSVYVPQGQEGKQMMVSFDSAWVTGNRFISQAITVDGGKTWHYRTGALKNQSAGWESVQVFDSFIMIYQNIMYLFHSGADTVGTALNLNIQIGVATYIPKSLTNLIISNT